MSSIHAHRRARSSASGLVAVAFVLAAACALVGCGPSVSKLAKRGDVDALARLAETSGQDYVRVSAAADAIGRIGDERAVAVLSRWVGGDVDTLRTAAIPALGATADPAAIDVLAAEIAELDESYPEEMDLRALVRALGNIDDPRAAKVLLAQVDAERSSIIEERYLGEALANQGEDIVPQLKRRLKGDNDELYLPCGVALYRLRADDKADVGTMLRTKATQRVWAGVFSEGAEESYEDDLVYALDEWGDVGLARRMLDSTSPKLDTAARTWAEEHGFMIMEIMQYGGGN